MFRNPRLSLLRTLRIRPSCTAGGPLWHYHHVRTHTFMEGVVVLWYSRGTTIASSSRTQPRTHALMQGVGGLWGFSPLPPCKTMLLLPAHTST